MNSPLELRIQSLAQAAAALGEPSVTAVIAGCVVTIHALHFGPDTAPLDRNEVAVALATGRERPQPRKIAHSRN